MEKSGKYEIEIVLTKARDYGIVQLFLDEEPLGGAIDLFNTPDVTTTGILRFKARELAKGKHKLSFKIVGTNPKALKRYMVGLDYVRLQPAE